MCKDHIHVLPWASASRHHALVYIEVRHAFEAAVGASERMHLKPVILNGDSTLQDGVVPLQCRELLLAARCCRLCDIRTPSAHRRFSYEATSPHDGFRCTGRVGYPKNRGLRWNRYAQASSLRVNIHCGSY